MKTELVKQGNKTYLNIEFSRDFEDNYKIHMLEENDIPGLLPVYALKDEGKSKYRYTVTGMTTMESRFEFGTIKKEDVLNFASCLLRTAEALRKFMLDADGLILYPKFLFWEGGNWRFCYIPIKKKPLNEEFHALAEYFEERVDDKDQEGILLIFRLHRVTLQKNRDLIKALRECGALEESHEMGDKEETIFEEYDPDGDIFMFGEDGGLRPAQPKAVREGDEPGSMWRRRPDRPRKNRWSLKGLIAETDGQGKEEGI